MSLRPYLGLLGQTILAMPLVAQVPQPIVDVNEITNLSSPIVPPGAPSRTSSSLPDELTLMATDRVWFAATSDTLGRELCRYPSPTPGEPLKFKDLVTPPILRSSDPSLLTEAGSRLFFAAKDAAGLPGLYVLDASDIHQKINVAGNRVEDIAPMSIGDYDAIVATLAGNTTTFWRVPEGLATASLLQSSTDYGEVSDLVDLDYNDDGFFAFTGLDNANPSPQRKLFVWSEEDDSPTIAHSGAVDNLTAVAGTLYFTGSSNSTLHKTTGGPAASIGTADSSHLMRASTYLYFLTKAIVAGSPEYTVRRHSTGGLESLTWPPGVKVKAVGSVMVTQDIPHVLGVGKDGTTLFSAIWKVNGAGTAMELVKRLDGWSDCSQLVANNAGKLAFVGRYPAVPDLPVPHLGFVDTASALEVPPTPAEVRDLRAGAMPTSLLALPNRVVFVADHRLQGIEPWYCEFPAAPDTN